MFFSLLYPKIKLVYRLIAYNDSAILRISLVLSCTKMVFRGCFFYRCNMMGEFGTAAVTLSLTLSAL